MEFTRINSAATAETSFTLAHPSAGGGTQEDPTAHPGQTRKKTECRTDNQRCRDGRPTHFRGFGILPGEKTIGGGQQHDPDDGLVYMRGQAEVASQKAEGMEVAANGQKRCQVKCPARAK